MSPGCADAPRGLFRHILLWLLLALLVVLAFGLLLPEGFLSRLPEAWDVLRGHTHP